VEREREDPSNLRPLRNGGKSTLGKSRGEVGGCCDATDDDGDAGARRLVS
jgi:hypothetical protein